MEFANQMTEAQATLILVFSVSLAGIWLDSDSTPYQNPGHRLFVLELYPAVLRAGSWRGLEGDTASLQILLYLLYCGSSAQVTVCFKKRPNKAAQASAPHPPGALSGAQNQVPDYWAKAEFPDWPKVIWFFNEIY